MDPQQRLFLGVAREAFQDAGQKLSPDGYNNVGLYVGTAHNTWELGKFINYIVFLHLTYVYSE